MDYRLNSLKDIFGSMFGFSGKHSDPFLTTLSLCDVTCNGTCPDDLTGEVPNGRDA
jgi:hypothetical protein